MRSLRRTLAVRFAATMAVGLAATSVVIWWTASRVLGHQLDQHTTSTAFITALLGIVILGSGATLIGAWRLAGSAVQPVLEITEQATHIEAGTLDQRISAHATTKEYRGLVAVLNRMLDRLSGAFSAQRRFTGDVSHELRTPLTALRGEIEVALRAERTPGDYQVVLRSALEEVERLTGMTEDLLLITRVEARLVHPEVAPTDVHAIVRDRLDGMRGRIEAKQLRVRSSLDPALGNVALAPALTVRLIDELLDNAVKFAPPGGEVIISTVAAASGLQLAVENSGSPLAAEELEHVFEPFYRSDPARGRGAGTGLGLTVAAALACVQGGTISASSRPNGGVRFEWKAEA